MTHTYKHETHRAFTLGILYKMLLFKDTTLNNTELILLITKNRLNRASCLGRKLTTTTEKAAQADFQFGEGVHISECGTQEVSSYP